MAGKRRRNKKQPSRSTGSSPRVTHEGDVFAKFENAPLVRRYLLENAKNSIAGMKEYYDLLVIRERKVKTIHTLKKELEELNILIKDLKMDLPIQTEREVRELRGDRSAAKIPKSHTDLKALDKLEKYLEDIEDSLKKV